MANATLPNSPKNLSHFFYGFASMPSRSAMRSPIANSSASAEVAHKWARWLHDPFRLRGSHCFREGGRIRSGPQVGKVAT